MSVSSATTICFIGSPMHVCARASVCQFGWLHCSLTKSIYPNLDEKKCFCIIYSFSQYEIFTTGMIEYFLDNYKCAALPCMISH